MLTATESEGMMRPNDGTAHSAAAESAASAPAAKHDHARGLVLIGLFKLGKFIFFMAVGLGALHLVHSNIGDLFLKVATWLHLNLDGKLVGRMEDNADLISGHQLRQVSLATCGYAIVSLIEGTGLMLEKTWAEYLTLTLTIGALPWEIFELLKDATATRWVVLGTNLLVLAYLVWFLKRKKRLKHEAMATVATPA